MIEVYHVDGRIEPVELPGKSDSSQRLRALQDIVGGYIEIVHLADGRMMVINEDGAVVEPPLPLNYKATSLVAAQLNAGDVIRGKAVVVTQDEIT
jgi:hypothetical protein